MAVEGYLEEPINFPLYKFTRRVHAEQFFARGELRLGTLYEYRDKETYGAGVLDGEEGFMTFKDVIHDQGTNIPLFFPTHATNNWIYCCTETFSPEFFDMFDADCCYRINAIDFFRAIDRVMESQCTSMLFRRIRYIESRRVGIEGVDFAGVFKENTFASQQEIRAFWEPKTIPVPVVRPLLAGESSHDFWLSEFFAKYAEGEHARMKPMIINVPEARSYCQRELIHKP